MVSHRGEVSCVVTTAKALDRATERELTSALEQFLEPGQKLHLSLKVSTRGLSLFHISRLVLKRAAFFTGESRAHWWHGG